ncbi:dynein regulation protein LC7 [Methanoculleus taiwanensis]|uniref:Dynein regulation protein LC7 n=1 Tax=Methanoculleus taiwanensis TaxID=1550565 RepID=A0A498GZE0_9EURY|nr:roadblock/LC7 domain-containing protein [Methanoculleus taiwanensis]RXE55455.1 dynein regulation protein LC7 [Methanoculleus taiwanensis]
MLPEGTTLGKMQSTLANIMTVSPGFTGALTITGPDGGGFLVVEGGQPIAARFEEEERVYIINGEKALDYLYGRPTLDCTMMAYTPEELDAAWEYCRDSGCLAVEEEPDGEEPASPEPMMSEERLAQIGKQPGVIAVSVFHEGFALQSIGNADVEQVAAVAEDLLRAGVKIVSDMEMGDLNQMILESPDGKLIIAPYGDLYICVFTGPDAHLGLIRLAIRGIQEET